MLKEIKFDFFKVFKSKSIIITLISTFLFLCLTPIITHVVQQNNSSVTNAYLGDSSATMCIIVFAIVFCGMDFDSGYLKNIYTNANKFWYVVSKALIILMYSLFVCVLMFVIHLIFVYAFGCRQIVMLPVDYGIGDNYTFGEFVCYVLIRVVGLTSLGLFVFLLCLLLKNIFVAIISFLWLFMNYLVYSLIDSIVNSFIQVQNFTVADYTLFGLLSHEYLRGISIPGVTTAQFALHYFVVYLIYGVVFFLLSWLTLSKKNF